MNNESNPRAPLLGAACAMVTMTIWAGWNIVSRLGVTNALTAFDVVFLRFATAGIIALPFVWRYRAQLRAASWPLLLVMICGAGCVYVLVATIGFVHAPASHGVLIPGTMPLWVALLSWLILKERFSSIRIAGYALIAATVIYRIVSHSENMDYFFADLWFLGAGFLWGCYTIANKKLGLPPLAAMAVVSLGSALLYCVPYAALHAEQIAQYPMKQAVTQMLYQGVLTSLVGLLFYNRAIGYIGAARASAFAATIPLLATLFGIPILGEIPRAADWLFVLLLSGGVLLATWERKRKAPPVGS